MSEVVPAGVIWVVRDADFLMAVASGGLQVVLGITAAGGTATAIYYDVVSDDQWLGWRGRQVLNPGDTLGVSVAGSGAVDATVSGYVLTLP